MVALTIILAAVVAARVVVGAQAVALAELDKGHLGPWEQTFYLQA